MKYSLSSLISLFVIGVLCAAYLRADVIEKFVAGEWRITNLKTPGDVTVEDGSLVIRDAPGGEAQWGTAAFKSFSDIDLSQTPYLVVDVPAMTAGFGMKLTGTGDGWKKAGVCSERTPGIMVIDIPRQTGWKGKGRLTVGLYSQGDGSSIRVKSLVIKGKLTAAEKKHLSEMGKGASAPPASAPNAPQLTTMRERRGIPPGTVDARSGERAVYIDPVTGHEVWRMTRHPSIERHIYYDILAWNADGHYLLFLSRRPGGNLWLMDADGRNIRPLPEAADGLPLKAPHWSPTNPDLLYFARPEEKRTRIVAMEVPTGKLTTIGEVPYGADFEGRQFTEMPPPHPGERYFLLRWGGQDKQPSFLVVFDRKTGRHWPLEPGLPTHRVRFTKAPDASVFVNSNMDPENPERRLRTEWFLSLAGEKRRLPKAGGHPDWSPGGQWLGAFSDGGIWLISNDGKTKKCLVETGAGGHGGFSITTGKYHVADAPRKGPFGNLVYVTELASGKVTPIAYHGSSYLGWGSGFPDPEATHPAPICSPDETKIVYDSDITGQPDVWIAVWKRPAPPREVTFSDGRLTWQPPELHREIARYRVLQHVDGAWQNTDHVTTECSVTDLSSGIYAVAAEEWSGLQSLYAIANTGGKTTDRYAPAPPATPKALDRQLSHLTLTWPPSGENDLDHYNIYAVEGTDCVPSPDTLLASPKAPPFVDWGLKSGTTYSYRISAVDRQGNESLPSGVLIADTSGAPFVPIKFVIGAESGTATPPMIRAEMENDPGTVFMHVPDEHSDEQYVYDGALDISIDIPAESTYIFWGRAMGLDGKSNSFFVSMDGSQKSQWNVPVTPKEKPNFHWQKIPGLEGIALTAGKHILRVQCREDGTRLDKILVTNRWELTAGDISE